MFIWPSQVVSALQDIEDADDLCPIEDSPPEKSYLPQCVPGMTCSRGNKEKLKQRAYRDKLENQDADNSRRKE